MQKESRGQAIVEYLLIFAFFSVISIGIVRSIGEFSFNAINILNYRLTSNLTSGVCGSENDSYSQCWHYSGYINRE